MFVEGAGVGCLWKEQVWGVCGRSRCGVFVEGAGVGCLWKEQVWGVCGRSRCGVFVLSLFPSQCWFESALLYVHRNHKAC